MPLSLPRSPEAFLDGALAFWTEVREAKHKNPLPRGDWYPYDTLSCLNTLTDLLSEDFAKIMESMASAPLADIGCADGDVALLFARLGAEVDAFDYVPNNYNQMEGIAALARLLRLSVRTFNLDLNTTSRLPRDVYGLAIFLGTLYHLKNPYSVLENLAYQTRWCILSTRIAQVTPLLRARVECEPLAYLADGREIANDPTNYWIFTSAGLLRILQRTRWAIVAARRLGCSVDSNPIDPEADERMFVLLKSRVHFPGLGTRLLEGWHQVEQTYRWTAKTFSIEVVLPLETPLSGFSLPVLIPRALVDGARPLRLSCAIKGHSVGTARYDVPGSFLFQGELPLFALHEPVLRLNFAVDSEFSPVSGDVRELGICVPVLASERNQIDFRVFGHGAEPD